MCFLLHTVELQIFWYTFIAFSVQYHLSSKYVYMLSTSYKKNQRGAQISQICFRIELYMFRIGFLYIISSLELYTQQKLYTYVIQVMPIVC
jgi:hypothetical protein